MAFWVDDVPTSQGGICMDMLVLWRVCWNFRGVNLPTSTGFLHISNLLKVKLWDLETGEVCNSLHCYWAKDFPGGGGEKGRFSYNHGESEGLDVVYTEYKVDI